MLRQSRDTAAIHSDDTDDVTLLYDMRHSTLIVLPTCDFACTRRDGQAELARLVDHTVVPESGPDHP